MKTKQVHVISSSEGEKKKKKRRVGGGREEQGAERKERWRKPWLQGRDGGKMMHGEDLRGVRTGRANGRMTGRGGRQITCSRCDAVVMVYRQDLLRRGESVPKPPSAAKATDEQQRLHSFQRERQRRESWR